MQLFFQNEIYHVLNQNLIEMNKKGRWNVIYGKTYFDCKMNDDFSGGHHIFVFNIMVNDMGSLGEMYMAWYTTGKMNLL